MSRPATSGNARGYDPQGIAKVGVVSSNLIARSKEIQ